MQIPNFNTVAGNKYKPVSLSDSEVQLLISNTHFDECKAYAESLEQQGYQLQYKREIPSGNINTCNNLFYHFNNDKNSIFVFYDDSVHSVRIVCSPLIVYPLKNLMSKASVVPSFTQLSIDFGMCYILQLADGRFVLFDGGNKNQQDQERLFNFLTSKSGGEKPIIALWLFSHPDEDHITLATDFMQQYCEQVIIESFSYNFPNVKNIDINMDYTNTIKCIAEFEKTISKFFPFAQVHKSQTGQVYDFLGAQIEIIHSLNDTFPNCYTSFNDVSSAWRIKISNGKTILLLGDIGQGICKKLANTFGEYLKSDILQVAHHGLIGGDIGLYKFIDPDICLWPTPHDRFLGTKPNQKYQWCLGEGGCDYNAWIRDENIKKRQHFTHQTTVTISFYNDGTKIEQQ